MTDNETISLPNGYHLVTASGTEITVDPCGNLLFPRHCTPAEVPGYLDVMAKAAELGAKIRIDNEARAADTTSKPLTTGPMIVTEGPPPPGAQQLPQRDRASIGRTPPQRRQARNP